MPVPARGNHTISLKKRAQRTTQSQEKQMTDMDYSPGAEGRGGTGTDVASRRTSPGQSGGAEGVKEQANEAAGTAASEGKRVAGIAGDEAQKVLGETKHQARALMDEARGQLEEQSRTQRDRLVEMLGTLGQDLDRMAGQTESGLASELVGNAAARVQTVSRHLEGREPAQLVDDVRDFARRRPGVFLLGALAAGVVAGRVARGAQKAHSDSSSTSTGGSGLGQQRATEYDASATTALPRTPEASAMPAYPPSQPGTIS